MEDSLSLAKVVSVRSVNGNLIVVGYRKNRR